MVGSVLLSRMREEGDLEGLEVGYFSTSAAGRPGPDGEPLLDAWDVGALSRFDVLLSCQGGEYTGRAHPALRNAGWDGIWIDAASALRMAPEATLVLDPINGAAIRDALARGGRVFCGPNCTVGLLLMGLIGLIRAGEVEWISTMTYQAASGAGAAHMRELVAQTRAVSQVAGPVLDDPGATVLELDRSVADALERPDFPREAFGAPLAASALPWIDRPVEGGQTREEWKAQAEAARLLGREGDPLPIDGVCVRIGAMRCHAQAVTLHLNRELPLQDVEALIGGAHSWVEVVPNDKESTLARLTPAAVAGRLTVPVGRIRPMSLGPRFLTAFTVGDQLLWGAAEPLRRMLRIVREHRGV